MSNSVMRQRMISEREKVGWELFLPVVETRVVHSGVEMWMLDPVRTCWMQVVREEFSFI